MKKWVMNVFLKFGKNPTRRNFQVLTDKKDEATFKKLINENLKVDSTKWDVKKDEVEIIDKEQVVIYTVEFIEK